MCSGQQLARKLSTGQSEGSNCLQHAPSQMDISITLLSQRLKIGRREQKDCKNQKMGRGKQSSERPPCSWTSQLWATTDGKPVTTSAWTGEGLMSPTPMKRHWQLDSSWERESVSLQACPSYLNHALVDDPTPLSKQEIRIRARLGNDRDQNTLCTHIKVLW